MVPFCGRGITSVVVIFVLLRIVEGSESFLYALDAVVYGGLGDAKCQAHFACRDAVEVEYKDCLFVGREAVDKLVEPFHKAVLAFLGEVVVGHVVETGEHRREGAVAHLRHGGVEGYAIDPGTLFALAPEAGPTLPQCAHDVLIHILDVLGVAVGKHKAHLEDGAVASAQHLQKCNMLAVGFHKKRFFYISRKKRQKLPQENEKKCSFIITALMFSAMKAESGKRRAENGERKHFEEDDNPYHPPFCPTRLAPAQRPKSLADDRRSEGGMIPDKTSYPILPIHSIRVPAPIVSFPHNGSEK